jgi:two-component system, sensor histidine kinase ChiS
MFSIFFLKSLYKTLKAEILSMLFCFLVAFGNLYANASTVYINSDFENMTIGKYIEILEDKERVYLLSDLLSDSSSYYFVKNNTEIINLGISNSAYWYRFSIENLTEEFKPIVLEHSFALNDYVDFYIPERYGQYEVIHSGNFIPIPNRSYPSKDYTVAFDLEPGERKQIFLRIAGRDSLYSVIKVWKPEKYNQFKTNEYMFHGAYFGLILFLTLYNLLVFLTTKDKDYIFYVLYLVFTALLFQGTINGFINEFAFPDYPKIAVDSQVYFYYITLIIYPTMASHILNLKKRNPLLFNILKIEAYIPLFGIFLIPIFGFFVMNQIANVYVFTILSTIIYASFYVLREGYRPAIFFLTAFIFVVFSGLILLIAYMGLIEMNYFVLYGYQIAQAISAILMGISLGDKINYFRKEKEITENQFNISQKLNFNNITKFNDLKNKFLKDVSLELLTPLTGIIGVAEYWKSNPSLKINLKLQQDLEVVLFSSKRISSLVNSIIEFSNIASQRIHIEKINLNLSELLFNLSELYSVLAERKGITIEVSLERHVFFEGDYDKIQQVFHNLFSFIIDSISAKELKISMYRIDKNIVIDYMVDVKGINQKEIDELDEFNIDDMDILVNENQSQKISLALSKKLIELHSGVLNILYEQEKFLIFRTLLNTESGGRDIKLEEQSLTLEKSSETDHSIIPRLREILIVIDDPINVYIIKNHLEHLKYKIKVLSTGAEAIDYCQKDEPPELIIIDMKLPDTSGHKVTEKIRQKYSLAELPILILNYYGINSSYISFKYGANDFLTKPVDRVELLNRVTNLLSYKKNYIENKKNTDLKYELNIAKNLQLSLLPKSNPNIQGMKIETCYIPMTYLAGDFFDYHIGRENQIGIIIADVTGHGVAAAMIASMFKTAFQVQRSIYQNPSDVMYNINQILFSNEAHLITAAYVLIDLTKKLMKISSAGHPPMWIFREGSELITLKPPGRILGFDFESKYETIEFSLQSGDRIFLYTDGVTDVINKNEEIIGEENIYNLIKEHSKLPAGELSRRIMHYLNRWSGKRELNDDISYIIIDIQ